MAQMLEVIISSSFLTSLSAKKPPSPEPHTPLKSPYLCFREDNVCGVVRKYPFSKPNYGFYSCGYPGLSIDCSREYGGRPFINISNHIYHVIYINYKAQIIHLVDIDVEGNECPQPKRNFSLPYAPSWVKYSHLGHQSVTVFYNCSSSPVDAEPHFLCSQDDAGSSHAFYKDEIRKESDLYRNCAENVVVPVFTRDRNYSYAIKYGFFIKWNTSNWCGVCEQSGGHCWSWSSRYNSTGYSVTGCGCKDGKSYFRSCPPPSPPPTPHPTPLPSPYQSQVLDLQEVRRRHGIQAEEKTWFQLEEQQGTIDLLPSFSSPSPLLSSYPNPSFSHTPFT